MDKKKKMEEFRIPGEGHTLGCMLISHMFDNGATFAACTVPHPQDTALTIKISHDTSSKNCLLNSILDAKQVLESWKRDIKNKCQTSV